MLSVRKRERGTEREREKAWRESEMSTEIGLTD
jgi:hypothetical protein